MHTVFINESEIRCKYQDISEVLSITRAHSLSFNIYSICSKLSALLIPSALKNSLLFSSYESMKEALDRILSNLSINDGISLKKGKRRTPIPIPPKIQIGIVQEYVEKRFIIKLQRYAKINVHVKANAVKTKIEKLIALI